MWSVTYFEFPNSLGNFQIRPIASIPGFPTLVDSMSNVFISSVNDSWIKKSIKAHENAPSIIR